MLAKEELVSWLVEWLELVVGTTDNKFRAQLSCLSLSSSLPTRVSERGVGELVGGVAGVSRWDDGFTVGPF